MLPDIDEQTYQRIFRLFNDTAPGRKKVVKIKREKIKWGRMCCKYFQTLITTNKANKMNFQKYDFLIDKLVILC